MGGWVSLIASLGGLIRKPSPDRFGTLVDYGLGPPAGFLLSAGGDSRASAASDFWSDLALADSSRRTSLEFTVRGPVSGSRTPLKGGGRIVIMDGLEPGSWV